MTARPYLLGLTGSIGMGKSTTAQMFAEAGLPVWDADAAVHRLYGPGGAALRPLAALRPEVIEAGTVSRARLKEWIAADPEALRAIERVVHPLVGADRAAFIAEARADILVLDVPLLFETGGDARVDGTVVVSAPAPVQRARVLARGTMSEAEFEAILAKQMPDADKRARATWVIETTTPEAARAAVARIIAEIRERPDA